MSRGTRAGRAAVVLVALVFAVPVLALVVQALGDQWRSPALVPQRFGLRGFRDGFDGTTGAALATSLQVGLLATAAGLLVGWPAARVLGERRLRRPGPIVLLLALPLLVPPFATGTGLTTWFIELGLIDTVAGIALAHLTVVVPYVVLVLAPAFDARLRGLEEMGRVSGLGPAARLRWVTLPAIRPALVTAALLGFLTSWSQYGSSLAIGGGRPTLPIVLLPYVRSDPQVAAALSLLFLAPAVAAVVVTVRRSRGPL